MFLATHPMLFRLKIFQRIYKYQLQLNITFLFIVYQHYNFKAQEIAHLINYSIIGLL